MVRSYKGKFVPTNPRKYIGNVNKIVFRSLLERRLMVFCDTNSDVIAWNSEEIVIQYISPIDNKTHRYFPDFFMVVSGKNQEQKKFMIEVKPYAQCFPPKGKNKTQRFLLEMQTYSVNQAKWKAAKYWCDQRGIEFKVMTEKELQPKK